MAILAFHDAALTMDCFLLFRLIAQHLESKPVHVSDPACVDVQPHPHLDNAVVRCEGSL